MNSKPVNYKEAVEYIEEHSEVYTKTHAGAHKRVLRAAWQIRHLTGRWYMWQEPMAKVLCVHIFRRS